MRVTILMRKEYFKRVGWILRVIDTISVKMVDYKLDGKSCLKVDFISGSMER